MNSKLRYILSDYRLACALDEQMHFDKPKVKDVKWLQGQYEIHDTEAEKAIRQAVGDEMLELIDGLEVDMEATEKHIRNAMAGKSEDDIAERLLSAGIDADDRKDTLDELRQKIKEWSQS